MNSALYIVLVILLDMIYTGKVNLGLVWLLGLTRDDDVDGIFSHRTAGLHALEDNLVTSVAGGWVAMVYIGT